MLQVFPSLQSGAFGRRQRHVRGARIPVTVVTGFLGAGKTTLVRHFMQTPEGRGTAVVVNEFGAEGIDDALLRASSDRTVLIGNGCLCCNVRSDLQTALHNLVGERTRGELPHFDRVVIETSGLADPGPILRTFATDRALGGEFHVGAVIAVVDVATGLSSLEQFPEARRQVMLADRLILSKADIGNPDSVDRVRRSLHRLNPRAAVTVASHGQADPACFLDAQGHDIGRTPFVAEAVHSDDIRSFTWIDDAPVDWTSFAGAMETLVALRGPDLLRAKGLLNVKGCRGPVVVQFVQHLAHPPVELADWSDRDRRSRLVFITRNLCEGDVKRLFDAVRALTHQPSRPSSTPRI